MKFPINTEKDIKSFLTGAGRFGAIRDGGKRLHGGCDIYEKEGTEVVAIEKGVVRRISTAFYRNVGAIEIIHENYIARYCEIEPLDFKIGEIVEEGQVLGKIKKIDGISQSMLHFEMYSNTKDTSPLSVKDINEYGRRKDILNPTEFLTKLKNNIKVETPKERVYTVVKGDTLYSIAERMYGDGMKYMDIYKMNNLQTKVLQIGQKLKY